MISPLWLATSQNPLRDWDSIRVLLDSIFFYWRIVAKFRHEKIPYNRGKKKKKKKKKTQIRQILMVDRFQEVATKEYRKHYYFFLIFFSALLSYVGCSQIWLKYFLDDLVILAINIAKETLLSGSTLSGVLPFRGRF
jgi:hypothetical protein